VGSLAEGHDRESPLLILRSGWDIGSVATDFDAFSFPQLSLHCLVVGHKHLQKALELFQSRNTVRKADRTGEVLEALDAQA
jgi:hypothetical protein